MKKSFAFIGKSLLWSLSLYALMMLAVNWDEVSNTWNGRNTPGIVKVQTEPDNASTSQANISGRADALKKIVIIVKTVVGIMPHSQE